MFQSFTSLFFRLAIFAFVALPLGCKTVQQDGDSLKEAETNDALPPSIFYHVGKRRNLFQNIAAGAITQEVWDKYIFGGPRFPLPMWRRGYYGASNAQVPFYYGHDLIRDGEVPWMEFTTIDSACLKPEVTFDQRREFVSESSAFMLYFGTAWSRYYPTLDAARQECVQKEADKIKYNALTMRRTIDDEDKGCDKLVHDFLVERQYKTVFDAREDNSWYLRDRACISKLTGTDDDMLTFLKSDEALWRDMERMSAEGLDSFESMILQSLGNASNVSIDDVQVLIRRLSEGLGRPSVNAEVRDIVWKETIEEMRRGLVVFEKRGKEAFQRYFRYAAASQIGIYFVRKQRES